VLEFLISEPLGASGTPDRVGANSHSIGTGQLSSIKRFPISKPFRRVVELETTP
jgi:hypothetical protein